MCFLPVSYKGITTANILSMPSKMVNFEHSGKTDEAKKTCDVKKIRRTDILSSSSRGL